MPAVPEAARVADDAAQPRPRAFEDFFADEYGRTVRVILALRGSAVAAEEIAQEAFLRAYLRWAAVSAMDWPGAWVRRVAVNVATSRLRRAGAETRALLRLAGRRGPDLPGIPDDAAAFWAAVRRLPRRQATAVALHYGDDLSVAAIAAVMGCAEGTVKSHLAAGRERLAEVLSTRDEP